MVTQKTKLQQSRGMHQMPMSVVTCSITYADKSTYKEIGLLINVLFWELLVWCILCHWCILVVWFWTYTKFINLWNFCINQSPNGSWSLNHGIITSLSICMDILKSFNINSRYVNKFWTKIEFILILLSTNFPLHKQHLSFWSKIEFEPKSILYSSF